MRNETETSNGILVLYRDQLRRAAPTHWEHINSFQRHSRFRVWKLNTIFGLPFGLRSLRFRVIVLHQTLLAPNFPKRITSQLLQFIEQSTASHKVAFLQDEDRCCQQRFEFLNRYKVDCLYTCVEPTHYKETYEKYTTVPRIITCLPGYVGDGLVHAARKGTIRDEDRRVDIGYRTGRLPLFMGRGAQEKHEIGLRFRELAAGLGLKLDIEVEEHQRIHGNAWYDFLANCRAVLGVESGATLFDLEEVARREYERLAALHPSREVGEADFRHILDRWDGNIPYRTASPRHFEAAAFRVCQILFEGNYSGIMKPMVHYIPLKKDFSNFDDVIRMYRDTAFRRDVAENAYRDLIASERFSYRRFFSSFDEELMRAVIDLGPASNAPDRVALLIRSWELLQRIARTSFPGRQPLASAAKPIWRMYHKRGMARYS